jgi:hypothetical protein
MNRTLKTTIEMSDTSPINLQHREDLNKSNQYIEFKNINGLLVDFFISQIGYFVSFNPNSVYIYPVECPVSHLHQLLQLIDPRGCPVSHSLIFLYLFTNFSRTESPEGFAFHLNLIHFNYSLANQSFFFVCVCTNFIIQLK